MKRGYAIAFLTLVLQSIFEDEVGLKRCKSKKITSMWMKWGFAVTLNIVLWSVIGVEIVTSDNVCLEFFKHYK